MEVVEHFDFLDGGDPLDPIHLNSIVKNATVK